MGVFGVPKRFGAILGSESRISAPCLDFRQTLHCTIFPHGAAKSSTHGREGLRILHESPIRGWHIFCGKQDRFALRSCAAMFLDTVDALANTAAAKAAFLKRSPGGFFVSSMMAGAFVGLGIILIFSLGSDV